MPVGVRKVPILIPPQTDQHRTSLVAYSPLDVDGFTPALTLRYVDASGSVSVTPDMNGGGDAALMALQDVWTNISLSNGVGNMEYVLDFYPDSVIVKEFGLLNVNCCRWNIFGNSLTSTSAIVPAGYYIAAGRAYMFAPLLNDDFYFNRLIQWGFHPTLSANNLLS